MDDITPLQQLSKEVLKSNVHLFTPRPAYRFQSIKGIQSYPNDQCAGQNPPYGASISYYWKSAGKGMAKITILDGEGRTIRTLRGPSKAGINRVWWNLRYESPRQARLRTKPPGNPHVWGEKRFKRFTQQGWMPLISWGIRGGLIGPLVVPGTYTVKLEVGGKEFTKKIIVQKDPHSVGSMADIQTQIKRVLEIQDNINTVVDSINQIEWVRKQIYDLIDVLEKEKSYSSIIKAAREIDKKLLAVEDHYFQKILAEGDLKSFRAPNKLYSQLAILAGDIAGSADFPPTDQQIEVHEELKKELAAAERELKELIDKDLAAFNMVLKENNINNIIIKMP